MKITKQNNKLTLIKEKGEKLNLIDFITGDDLFNNDLTYYHSYQDEWQYLYDANRNLVFTLDNYGWNAFDDLITNGTVTLDGAENTNELYGDYEWNSK